MLRRCLVVFVAATACVQEPGKPDALGDAPIVSPPRDALSPSPAGLNTAPGAAADTPSGGLDGGANPWPARGPAQDEVLFGRIETWAGMGVEDASLCTVEGCVQAEGTSGVVELPEGEVDVRVAAAGTVSRHLQVVRGGDVRITVPTVEEADAIAASVGAVRTPGTGTLIQFVRNTWPVHPELSVEADGPYFLDGAGVPLPDADGVTAGYYVYFDVPPGLHTVDLPGCDEGELFWGTPSDESIDLLMEPDAWLGLAFANCLH